MESPLDADEREKWNALFAQLHLQHSDAHGNFVFFDAGRPQPEVAQALLAQGVEIGRGYPPLNNWVRISIGLPPENDLARAAVRGLYASS